MARLFAVLLVVHGSIHLLGTAKAFGWAELLKLTQPISPPLGVAWLVAALLFFATASSLFMWPRGWWLIGACAVIVSMLVLIPAWNDAKAGAVANGIVAVGVVFGFLSQGPYSLRAEYEQDIERHVLTSAASELITEADLVHLPAPVQRYLRVVGVIGQRRVRNFHVTMHGRIRNGPHGRWMPFIAEQHNTLDPPTRLFYLDASMFGVPVQGYHRYVAASASMRVKAAALVPVATASGGDMTQSETVTMFNDMCIMAPATLIDPAIAWEAVDARTVRARFTNAGYVIRADLSFNDAGELVDFVSDDRSQTSSDASSMTRRPWSTPLGDYRSFGAVRLGTRGEGRWHEASGAYAYIELRLDDVRYNVGPMPRSQFDDRGDGD